MKLTITGRGCTPKDSFKERAEIKMTKIDRFFNDDATGKIVATAIGADVVTIEFTVKHKGLFFRTEATDSDMSAALDICVENMIRKVRKHKTKIEKKTRSGSIEDLIPNFDEPIEEEDYELVRRKSIGVKPQSVEEAILQMNLLGHDFYMFINQETDQVNVVYARDKGGYGLLEPSI